MKIKSVYLFLVLITSALHANTLPKKCITHVCSGGLGQDLFSFAAAYSHAKRLNIPLILDSDNDNGLLSIFKDKFKSVSRKKFAHFPIVVGINNDKSPKVYNYNHGTHDKPNVTYYSNTCYGYYLSLKWFENEFEEVKSMIIPPEKTLDTIYKKYEEYLSAPIKVGIHLRTYNPDKVKTHHVYPMPTIQYLEKAFPLLPDDALFFVASDNMPVAKEMLSHFNKKFIFLNDNGSEEIKKFTGNETTLEEFFLLTMCDHLLGSQSTFSWWAAHLIKNPEKIIILPDAIAPQGFMIQESWNLIPYQ